MTTELKSVDGFEVVKIEKQDPRLVMVTLQHTDYDRLTSPDAHYAASSASGMGSAGVDSTLTGSPYGVTAAGVEVGVDNTDEPVRFWWRDFAIRGNL